MCKKKKEKKAEKKAEKKERRKLFRSANVAPKDLWVKFTKEFEIVPHTGQVA